MVTAALIQLFWASFVILGLAVCLVIRRLQVSRSGTSLLWDFIGKTNPLVVMFVLFSAGVGTMIIPTTLGYFFEWQVWYLSAIYLVMLCVAIVLLWRDSAWVTNIKSRHASLSRRSVLVFCLVIVSLGLDYVISLHTGGRIDDDAPVHLAKIQLFLNTHMTLADPFVGYNGILDLRYATNVMNALQALIANLLHIPAYKVWFYSYAFYKLVIWLSLFSLAWVFLPSRTPKSWPYIVLILCPLIYTEDQFFSLAELPHIIVLAWVSLMMVGIKLLLEKKGSAVFLLSAALVATTHAITAMYAMIYICALATVLVLARRITKQTITVLMLVLCMLAVPVAANMATPNNTHNFQGQLFRGTGLHGKPTRTKAFGPIVVAIPQIRDDRDQFSLVDPALWFVSIFMISCLFVLKKVNDKRIKHVLLAALILALFSTYNVLYASVIGYAYLIWKTKYFAGRLMIFTAVAFYALFAYNPIVSTAIYGHLPLWLMARSQDLNTFAFIAPILGLLVVYKVFVSTAGLPRLAEGYNILALILLSVFVPGMLHRVPIDTGRIMSFDATSYKVQRVDYKRAIGLEPLEPYIKNQVIFTNDLRVTSMIGFVPQRGTLGLLAAYPSNQSQNLDLRVACHRLLYEKLRESDLRAAHITSVILKTGYDNGLPEQQHIEELSKHPLITTVADGLPYLTFEKQTGVDRIYRVNEHSSDSLQAPSPSCQIPRKQ